MNPKMIVGPPGTGKTTRLVKIVEELLTDGYGSADIAYLAFTRKAANEARNRMARNLGYGPDDLPWFRTLHSLIFRQLGLSRKDIMGHKDYYNLAHNLGLHITLKGVQEDGTIMGLSKGDRLLFMEAMARGMKTDLRTYWEQNTKDEDIEWPELKLVAEAVKQHKEAHGKLDFIDMVYNFIREGSVPVIRVLIVDEAQDLTSLQWDAIDLLKNQAEEVYIGGDDDQTIFRWAGADVDRFIDMPAEREVLPQSYRVPARIQEVANRVIGRVKNRIDKTWQATKELGEVAHVSDVSHLDLKAGTWLLLARNVYLLQQYVDHCREQGYVYESILGSSSDAKILRAIKSWESLRRGDIITVAEAIEIYDLISSESGGVSYGCKKKLKEAQENAFVSLGELRKTYGLCKNAEWDQVMDRIPLDTRIYLLAAFKRGESLTSEPRIKINTIHGVKGGEADCVVLCTDMAERTYNEYLENPDDEHRVWYVGVTRARHNLYILDPQTSNCYDLA